MTGSVYLELRLDLEHPLQAMSAVNKKTLTKANTLEEYGKKGYDDTQGAV